ncbi:acidic repeat-containing protein-like [Sceloporus undulatus]|uniref:acidic repeat-containing protein-like n=1 Tax=Sceloporus undulatus TaxID=8520 RepID=UPI001C4AC16C|nr:acidic repeat-containing protein-like [Sceloporus undulatus]
MRETSGSESSDEEIASLAVRVKQAMVFSPRKSALRLSSPFEERGPRPSPRSLLPAAKKEPSQPPGPDPSTSAQAPKNKALADVTQLHQTQPPRGRSSCQIPGCFLEELSDPESQPSRLFCSQKEKLAQDLYAFYNTSVFEEKLPGRMEILWNKKMRKTAGCCVSGQQKEPGRQRYARIMLSEKVCDSADRLRDTLIHELCHAATWLIHGVRDGHGRFWNLYAKKAAMVHPELPVVSRCHNYEIKYKFTYECIRCRNTLAGGLQTANAPTAIFFCRYA